MSTVKDFLSPRKPTWCPGCGNFGIWNALKAALANQNFAPHEVLLFTGIGCGSKLPDYTRANGLLTIHGRTVAVATGAQLANHGLKIVLAHGDGDAYSMGGNHFLHAIRRNLAMVDIVQNNRVYGLTKGQYSPTSERGFVTKTSPAGAIETPLNPLAIALTAGATFVARGYAGDMPHLTWLIEQALQHRGYCLVDVCQPCVSFNKQYSYQWYQSRIYKLQDEKEYDVTNLNLAISRALAADDRVPLGIFYQVQGKLTYSEQVPALKSTPLVKQPLRTHVPETIKDQFI